MTVTTMVEKNIWTNAKKLETILKKDDFTELVKISERSRNRKQQVIY